MFNWSPGTEERRGRGRAGQINTFNILTGSLVVAGDVDEGVGALQLQQVAVRVVAQANSHLAGRDHVRHLHKQGLIFFILPPPRGVLFGWGKNMMIY